VRRWSRGRLTAAFEEGEENEWLENSSLTVTGRPEVTVLLPEPKMLTIPESLDVSKDFRFADRKRLHPDQVVAAKGPDFVKVLLQELLDGMNFNERTQLIIVNVAPYIEDAAKAYIGIQLDPPEGWPIVADNLHYMSLHYVKGHYEWSTAMIKEHLEDLWIAGKVHAPGYKLNDQKPTLTDKTLCKLGTKGKAALGDLTGMEFEVLIRMGSSMVIGDDHLRTWSSAPATFKDPFDKTAREHKQKYENIIGGPWFNALCCGLFCLRVCAKPNL